MSTPFLEPFSHLVSEFNFRRAISLVAILFIFGCAAWTVDYYAGYSRTARLDHALTLIERIDNLDRRGAISKDLSDARASVVKDLTLLLAAEQQPSGATSPGWIQRLWPKALAGAAPWLILSLFALPGLKKGGSAAAGFAGLLFISVFFGLLTAVIPTTGNRLIDFGVIPWGIAIVTGVIPISFAAIDAFRKVRDSSIQKSIMNNLRQVAAAAAQYYLEHGVDEALLTDLVGPDKYIKTLTSVDGERYEGLVLKLGQPLAVRRKSGQIVQYSP